MSVRGKLAKALRCAVFLCILGLIVLYMGVIFRSKNQEYLSQHEPRLKENEYEVLLLGPSTIMNGVYPLQLWDEYGIVSYNCGSGGQTYMASYYVLKELIRRGNPKLLVLDCGKARSKRTAVNIGSLHYTTDVMNYLSPERWDMIRLISKDRKYTFDEVMGLAVPIFAYHERWQYMHRSDLKPDSKYTTYGAKIDPRVCTDAPEIEPYEAAPDAAIPAIAENYLRKILDLCKEQGIEVLLMTMPNMTLAHDVSQKDYCKRVDAASVVQRIADEYGVVHLNLMDQGEAIGLIPRTDTGDGQHLNYMGAPKFTSWLGAYIREHYDVPDHSADSSYAFLDEAYEAFCAYRAYYVEEWARTH